MGRRTEPHCGLLNRKEISLLKKRASWHSPQYGDILVAGTFYGTDVSHIAKAFYEKGKDAPHFIVLDSFRGVAQPTGEDRKHSCRAHEQGELSPSGLANFAHTTDKWCSTLSMEIHKDFITEESLSRISKRPLRMFFLDLDHYQPVKLCLEKFWDWLVPEGWALSHDYKWGHTGGVTSAITEFSATTEKSQTYLDPQKPRLPSSRWNHRMGSLVEVKKGGSPVDLMWGDKTREEYLEAFGEL